MFENEDYILLEKLDVNSIINLYKKAFDIDVSYLFNNIIQIEYREHKQSGIKFFEPIISGDESFYEQLQKFDWYYQKRKNEYDFASTFTKNKTVLEIGAGAGWFYDLSSSSQYVGLEFNPNAITKMQNKGLTVFQQTISEFAQKNSALFDVVCSFQVLEHVEAPIQFLCDSLKCLKNNGLLIVSVPAEDSFVGVARNNILNMPPHHLTRWPDKSFVYLQNLIGADLVKIHHEYLDNIHNRYFANVFGREVISGFLSKQAYTLFDNSKLDKLIAKAGSLLGRFLEFGIRHNSSLFLGHTVSVIYRKR